MMLLTTITFLPAVACMAFLIFKNDNMTRLMALSISVVEFLLSLGVLLNFDGSSAQIQMAEKYPWIPGFGINYFLGIDGISLWLVLLTTFLTPLTILASWHSIDRKVKTFHVCLLLLETAMIGAFVALDAVLFFAFWELMLVPMFLLIGVWGGERRIYAAVKFFIYTMAGSIFMLVAIIALMHYTKEQSGALSANILDFYRLKIPFDSAHFFNPQTLMFFAFSLAFAIKVPMFPLHTWLPDAHVQAPTPGSVILAGVLLKMGTYGFLRFAIPLFPEAAEQFAGLFMWVGIFGIVYGAWVAMVQPDMKKLVAYSSVSHLGYVVLGLFTFNIQGVSGGLYQMLNHGVSTGGLFLLVGMIYERTHSREIAKYGGLAKVLPVFAVFFFLVTISSIAVPGTNGFIGEFLILLGTFKVNMVMTAVAVTGIIWGAAYMLWLYKRTFFGPAGELVPETAPETAEEPHGHGLARAPTSEHKHPLFDLSLREVAVLSPLVILIFWMGIYPNSFLDKSQASLKYFVENRQHYNLTVRFDRSERPGGPGGNLERLVQKSRGFLWTE